ncbi:MAG: OmpA family protein [Bacteroidota bacterium]
MKFLFAAVVYFLFLAQVFSQTKYVIKPENADCSKAIEIKDTIFGPTNAPSGFGNVMEISGDKNSLYAFEKEHNTVWYYFKPWADCELELDIIPVNSKDDYDFVLYKYSGKTFFVDVKENKIQPVRTCISRNDKKNGSKTGLKKMAEDEFIHSGPGASYSKSIFVKKGEVYYLCVDNVYSKGGGHTIVLHYSGCKKPVVVQKTQSKTTTTNPVKPVMVDIKVFDKETQNPVKANLKIYIKNKTAVDPLLKFDSVMACKASLAANGSFVVKSEANNFFDNANIISTMVTTEPLSLKIELSRIKVGQNVVFENILFVAGRADFIPESGAPLQVIANTMKRYPGLKIEIQGHVNCPSSVDNCDKMEETNLQLSIDRAEAVFKYLIKAGINPNRMTFKGFGATKMIYPDARSEDKMEKNRRVEIIVMAVE